MLRRRIRTFTELLSFAPPALPTEATRVAEARSLDDLRRLAKRRVPGFVFDYVEGAAVTEQAARDNESAFARRRFVPSVTESAAGASLATRLLGREHAMPIGIAPIGLTALMRAAGETDGVRAAANRNVPFVLSTMGTRSIEHVADAAPDARRWFQLYLRRDRAASLALIERAAVAGFDTLVLTVDTRVPGQRYRDDRNRLSMPPRLTLRTAAQSALHPAWSLDLLAHDAPAMANFGPRSGSVTDVVSSMFDPALSLDDVRWLRGNWNGPIVVKGVLSATDAERFIDAGADAIWLSNHGGRQLDRAIAPIEVVGAVRAALGDDVPIVLDSGIRSGLDVVAAIAAGADFVFLGRGYMYGLMAGGRVGVERALDLVANETLSTMQLLGVRTTAELRGRGTAVLAPTG
ncbi:alpha-hydroxy acid oxidase [Microbacterium paraoxydans]|uniref:alpha-hydroxy acid oxidase n=1 Tax=Microbacterium TaxID=33882 RepID=UPI0011A0F46A|nr:alpha-hydroxy acid oxidase [Microbacterium paraoxydans]MCT2223428.1 alpha-hydroxy-acid oxidizing protein [Microbacterium paraoxydans]